MERFFLIDFIKGNRASSATIAITVLVSSFLLSLLCTVFFNFWVDEIVQTGYDFEAFLEYVTGSILALAILYLAVVLLSIITIILIIRNAFMASMQNRVHQLGLLSSVGATPKQIRNLLLKESMILSLIPAIVGLALGIFVAFLFVNSAIGYTQSIGIENRVALQFYYHPLVLCFTLLVIFLTVLISAEIPARRLSKTKPLDAISGLWTKNSKAAKQKRIWLGKVFGIEGEVAAQSMQERKSSLRTATFAIGISFFVLCIFLTFMTISRLSVQETYYERFGIEWDYTIDVANGNPENFDKLLSDVSGFIEEYRIDNSDNGIRLYLKTFNNAPIDNNIFSYIQSAEDSDIVLVDMDAEKKRSEDIWNGYILVVGGFCGILALIGIAGIVTQSIGFVYQRKREFARLKSIGMTPSGVNKMLGVEGLLLTVRPFLVVIPIAIVLAGILIVLGNQSLMGFLGSFPFGLLLAYMLTIIVLNIGINIIGATRINRSNLADTLKDDVLL